MPNPADFESALREAAQHLKRARKIVVFTGAGVSAESGIGTFRDDDGLWTRFPPEQFANWESLLQIAMRAPARAAQFFVALMQPMLAAQPNAGHRAIASLESRALVTVVTQNIDALHEAAGSRAVHAVHGSLYETMYLDGTERGPVPRDVVSSVVAALGPLCQEPVAFEQLITAVEPLMGADERGPYRPKIVLFGDQLAEPEWMLAQEAASECECMISVGTSGTVYPAADLPNMARAAGAKVIGVDPQPVDADIWLPGAAGTVLPALVAAAYG
jgi:NAD-dependent deacetylase